MDHGKAFNTEVKIMGSVGHAATIINLERKGKNWKEKNHKDLESTYMRF